MSAGQITLAATLALTCATVYIAFLTLRHSAKPKIKVALLSYRYMWCGHQYKLVFGVSNPGHWYSSPPAIDVSVFFNFPPEFDLLEIGYGSDQSVKSSQTKIGAGGSVYFKAKGLKLIKGEVDEEVHIIMRAPATPGEYVISVSSYSENSAYDKTEARVYCRNPSHGNKAV